jgi:hypothetical protein
MKREEIAKIRRELQATERALGYAEKKETVNKNLGPVTLPQDEKSKNPAPKAGEIPDVITLPPKQKRTENKW